MKTAHDSSTEIPGALTGRVAAMFQVWKLTDVEHFLPRGHRYRLFDLKHLKAITMARTEVAAE